MEAESKKMEAKTFKGEDGGAGKKGDVEDAPSDR